jgi:hypothetical protein
MANYIGQSVEVLPLANEHKDQPAAQLVVLQRIGVVREVKLRGHEKPTLSTETDQ